MYLTYHNLNLKPFEESLDPRFFWLSDKHKEALACFKHGIQENTFLLLNGDIGTGKSALINYFFLNNDIDAMVATIPDPDLSVSDFYRLLSKEFRIDIDLNTEEAFLIKFEHFLQNAYSEGKKVLLIIDEAQRLNQQLMEQICHLSNIEREEVKLINIFFVGQNEVLDFMNNKKNDALCQRPTVHHTIEALTESETQEYIKYRLSVAGSKTEIFNSEAIHEIFSFSKGYPRLINIICDRALLTSYVLEANIIGKKIVKQCADDLKILVE